MDGLTRRRVLTLESKPVVSGYAYSAVIQSSDGRVRVTYTFGRKPIKHVVIDSRGLAGGTRRVVSGDNSSIFPRNARRVCRK
jgi:hypothetical protein